MIEHIRALQELVNDLQGDIRKIKSKQVYHSKILKTSKAIVDNYFRETRDQIVSAGIDSNIISELDRSAQRLLEATHKKTTIDVYKKRISILKKLLVEIEKLCLTVVGNSSSQPQLDLTDTKIIDTLKKILLSAALSYEQALVDMQSTQRLSWRGPATDFREALRECLDHFAPDKEVMSVSGFKLEPNTTHPTMKQKTQYILQKRGLSSTSIKTAQDSVAIIDGLMGSFVRSVYSRASMSTHTPTDKTEVTRIRDLVRLVLCELLSIS